MIPHTHHGRRLYSRDPNLAAKKQARLEAFADAYAEFGGDDVLAARKLGMTVTVAKSLVRALRREGRA